MIKTTLIWGPVNLSKVLHRCGFWGMVFKATVFKAAVFGLLAASKTAPKKIFDRFNAPLIILKNLGSWRQNSILWEEQLADPTIAYITSVNVFLSYSK